METEAKTIAAKENSFMEIVRKFIPFLGLIIMIIVFQVFGQGRLLTKGNLISVLNQTVFDYIRKYDYENRK